MDFRYLFGDSEPLGTRSVLQDVQLELQELLKRRQELSSKLNAFALEITQIQNREEELLAKLRRSPALQEASSSMQCKMEPPTMPTLSTANNNALGIWQLQHILAAGTDNASIFGSALDIGALSDIIHQTPPADVTSTSATSEMEHALTDGSNAAAVCSTRKRPSAGANSSVDDQVKKKKKLCEISFEELRGHFTNFDSLHDHVTGEFKCPVCGLSKMEPKRYNTIRHLLSHLSDGSYHPYKCPVEGCDASSVGIDDMQKHVVNVHKLEWTKELKADSVDAEKKALLDSLLK